MQEQKQQRVMASSLGAMLGVLGISLEKVFKKSTRNKSDTYP
jgi:hypothetical protein